MLINDHHRQRVESTGMVGDRGDKKIKNSHLFFSSSSCSYSSLATYYINST